MYFKTLYILLLSCFFASFSLSACNIDIVGAIGGACQDDGTVLYRIIVNYQNAPGPLDVNGTIYPVQAGASASQQNLYLWLPGDGESVTIIAQFVDEPNCKDVASNLFTATCCIPDNQSCNDGNPLTINDKYTDCLCEGVCGVVGNSCNDGNAATYNDTYNANCECVGIPCPAWGSSCDDGNLATYNDREDGFCNCIGTPCPSSGSSCNDGDPTTYNDIQDGFCNCEGTPCPSAGTACNDGDPNTINDVEDGFCNCAGSCPLAGTACNDGNPNTSNDIEDGNCNCSGTIVCPPAGTVCNDGDPNTSNDIEDGNCNCSGVISCLPAGTTCDDGDANTINDVEDGNCNCAGTPFIIPAGDYTISVKMFLEGYYAGSSLMRRDLYNDNLVPDTQPYDNSSILNYNGNESLNNNIADVIDWVMIALFDSQGNILGKRAAVLTKNGIVRDASTGNPPITFPGVDGSKNYRIGVFHRSHLAVISGFIKNNGFADFSQAGTAQGNVQTTPTDGEEALFAGDLNQDGLINNLDYNIWNLNNSAVFQYVNQDIDGNGIVNNLDFNLWDKNKSKVGHSMIQL